MSGIKQVMAITDGDLNVRGMVGVRDFRLSGKGADDTVHMRDLLGDGQVQVVRNHPAWKQPMNGITGLRDGVPLSLNLALYMAESEQRSAVIVTDIKVDGSLCRHALGVMVERLPGCTDENIEKSISNLESVERRGLRSYLDRSNWTDEEKRSEYSNDSDFRGFSGSLNKILDDCLSGMGQDIRWSKTPKFKCSCGVDRVWRALRLLDKDEVRSMVTQGDDVSISCGFCGSKYSVTPQEMQTEILDAPV
jgi:molecular chaperone Hsp33